MISEFKLDNFGPIKSVIARDLSKINLIIGANSSGKTFLLKALYGAIRSHELTGRGDDNREFADIYSEKLYWTFQTDKLGDIVTKGSGNRLGLSLKFDDGSALELSFGQDTKRRVSPTFNSLSSRSANSIFLPPKEVLYLARSERRGH